MPDSLKLEPIGHVRTGGQMKFDAPHQPDSESLDRNRIELLAGQNFELALQDLAGFDRIWVVSWFDRNTSWRPRVMPPRGPAKRRGVFATRSPHRPNPIGLTCVPLHSVSGLVLEVGPLDLVDGTPILDIKPYLTTVDCFPESSLGWLESVVAADQLPPPFNIVFSPLATEQLDWLLENWGIDFINRATKILSRDPSPHRTRRILMLSENQFRMSCGAWRIYFTRQETQLEIQKISHAYTPQTLQSPENQTIPEREAIIAFTEKYLSI